MYPQGSKKSSSLNTKDNETADMETQITAEGKAHCQGIVYTRFGIKTDGACCAFYAIEKSKFCKRHQNYKGKLNERTD